MAQAKVFVLAAMVWLYLYIGKEDLAGSRVSFAIPRRGSQEAGEGAGNRDPEEPRLKAVGRLCDLAVEHYKKEDFKQAVQVLREAVDLHGPSNSSCLGADALLLCSKIHWDNMGFSVEALPLAEEALRIRREDLGQTGLEIAESLNWVAALYWNVGELPQAVQLYNQSLALERDRLGTEDEDLEEYQGSLEQLALIYKVTGDFAQAVPLFKESMRFCKNSSGAWSKDHAASITALAEVYLEMGSLAEAEPLLIHCLAITQKVHGPRSREYTASLSKLAGLWQKMGKHEIAVSHYEHVLTIRRDTLGINHTDYFETLETLGELHKGLGDLAKAATLFEEASKIRKELYGTEGAASLERAADVYSEMGALEKALRVAQERSSLVEARSEVALDSMLESLERCFADLTLDSFATLIEEQPDVFGHVPLQMYMASLQCLEDELGTDHRAYSGSLDELANLFERLGKIQWALPLYEESRKIQEGTQVGSALAETLETLEGIRETFSSADPYTEPFHSAPIVACLQNLATMYRERADYARAEYFSRRALCTRHMCLRNVTRMEVLRSQLARAVGE